LTEETCGVFSRTAFEHYYPQRFAEQAEAALSLDKKSDRKSAKALLLNDVRKWTALNEQEALGEWKESAREVIDLLKIIEQKLNH